MKKLFIIALLAVLMVSAASAKTFTFETGSYWTDEDNTFDILKTDNTETYYSDGELVLPRAVILQKFPDTQVVEEIRLIEFGSPVELIVDIPQAYESDFLEYTLTERACYSDTQETDFFVNDPVIMGNEATYSIEIYPVEVVDCLTGKIILYQTVEYEADIVDSTSRIEYYEVEGAVEPGKTVNVKIVMNKDVEGTLRIKNLIDEEITTRTINSDRAIMSFRVPEDYDREQYILEFIEEGIVVAYKDFIIESTWGKVDFKVYKSSVPLVIPIKINFTNVMGKEIDADVSLELLNIDSEVTKTINFTQKIIPGSVIKQMNIEVTEEQKENDIRITAVYDGQEEYALHNTIMRIDPDKASAAQEEYEKMEAERQAQPPEGGGMGSSTAVGIIFVLVLFAIVVYLVRLYMKSD